MPAFDDLLHNITSDVEKEIIEAVAENFRSQSFFGESWQPTKRPGRKKKILHQDGHLENSITSEVSGHTIRFSSSMPYAAIHNEGGEVTVTPAMKKYYWAMYYQAAKGITKRKDGKASASRKNVALTAEAEFWKRMALMKPGSKIKIPKRQFFGQQPQERRKSFNSSMVQLGRPPAPYCRRAPPWTLKTAWARAILTKCSWNKCAMPMSRYLSASWAAP